MQYQEVKVLGGAAQLQQIETEVEHSNNLCDTFSQRVRMIAYCVTKLGGLVSLTIDEEDEGVDNIHSCKFVIGDYTSPTVTWDVCEGQSA